MSILENKWDDAVVAKLDLPAELLYRSNLLGSDMRITNFGGGNTSSKINQVDALTKLEVEVLWVKGSGGDVGTMQLDGFATLYMDKLRALKGLYRGIEFEDEMVAMLPHCTFNLNSRAASIDTALHAYLPYDFVDHMHPDAIIAIAAAKNSKALTKQIYGARIGWLPWKKPGFELGLMLEKFATDNPDADGVVLESHGLFTWGHTGKACYTTTLDIINIAIKWFETETKNITAFGGAKFNSLAADERQTIAASLMPEIRGHIAQDISKVGHFSDSPEVLEFVNSAELKPLAALGTSCPDHFLRTKICPLVIDFDPQNGDIADVVSGLKASIEEYRQGYEAYYNRCKRADSPAMRDPNAVVYLIPGVGMITFANNKATARISAEFYTNAINVMRGASSVSTYVGLDEQEAFDIEYWLLEEAKLQRMPKPKSLAGRVALVTGGAGGIGSAVSARLLAEGACVLLTDIDTEALANVSENLTAIFGADQVRTMQMNVTSEDQVKQSFDEISTQYGGIDILVSNAGISSSAPIEDTELSDWNRNMDILATGYFLVSREAFRVMKRQGLGGAIVFIASKNGLAASPNAAAYCTAKAAEIHLARCLALEGAPMQIRVNTVNPDAVLAGSKIWTGEWRKQRAAAYNMDPDGLEEHYRKRSLLKRSVLPTDIAEAAYFLVSDQSSKSTGNIINVDAGNAQSFTR
ncbi:MAG: bifunctional rhamnulose-1-phosphate aldolase/short-chain dehydrogenase [Rhizobiales bacterium]|nr:bifunctional rhamnulose-1-phosphate aldolase/short-chain dehydrogenase [Hyphomicrobiales bacterium]NRB15613.1 bifunctional rhamnulose-1-phosphate aldolase/short-chain dehydrogenase [Hyphomicrobiales bacterium]